jgi:sRNA-binding protein
MQKRGLMPHTGTYAVEYRRGLKESQAGIAALQERWPAAFPRKPHLVRPLVAKLHDQVAAEMGWSKPYTRAVIRVWKLRDGYCHAVLAHERRYDLAGVASGEAVDDEARSLARQRLAINREARARRLQAQAAQQTDTESKAGESSEKPTPPETAIVVNEAKGARPPQRRPILRLSGSTKA